MTNEKLNPVDWREANRANWDERVPVHVTAPSYDLQPLRSGRGKLHPIEESELGSVDGLRVLHLQCHFGRDSLTLAQRGAQVVGVDFSAPAIIEATNLTKELNLSSKARFIECDVYHAQQKLQEPASFDLVYVTWGTIIWLPDISEWARVVASFLKPGGKLYFADGHPAAYVFDDGNRSSDNMPGFYAPYFQKEALIIDDSRDYASDAVLQNSVTFEWMHTLSSIVTSLIDAGMTLDWLHEHDSVSWRMFEKLVEGEDGMYRWPDKAWLPLAVSLKATRT